MSKVDKAVCLAILKRGLRNSWYYYQSGQQAHAYINIDISMLGDDDAFDSAPQHERIEQLAEQFLLRISEIEEESPFDRLVFIDKAGHGPVGVIALSGLLIWKSKKDAIFVRPYRHTIRSTTKGNRIQPSERFLVISDVATTGQTILKAARKLWESGATVTGALVFFDQELGAEENLHSKDIRLYSLYKKSEVEEPGLLPDRQAQVMCEFGGVM